MIILCMKYYILPIDICQNYLFYKLWAIPVLIVHNLTFVSITHHCCVSYYLVENYIKYGLTKY